MNTPLNIQAALKGRPVILRNGYEAQVLADLRLLPQPINRLVVQTEYETFLVHPKGMVNANKENAFDILHLKQYREIPWENLDPKWQVIAADADGKVYLYTQTELAIQGDVWAYMDKEKHCIYFDVTNLFTLEYDDWKESKQVRPC